jgi:hypothetical protein
MAEPDHAGWKDGASGGGRSTTFVFEHKVFALPEARFRMCANGRDPALFAMLGDLEVALPIDTIAREFAIEHASADASLLDLIGRSLKFVREIRPGDSIPNEVLDGSASWSVQDIHRQRAQARLTIQLASWINGAETVVAQGDHLAMLADDPKTKERVQQAFELMAERLGFGRENKQKVVDRVEQFARELAYIEALRDRYGLVREVGAKIKGLAGAYKRERTIAEDLVRLQSLMRHPINEFDHIFTESDAQSGEILSVMMNLTSQIAYVRETRDELHTRLMEWDPLIAQWGKLVIERSEVTEAAIRALYRFLAPRYAARKSW